jgi:hypothetical protein
MAKEIKIKDKLDPKEDLVIEQLPDLNKMFYRDFIPDYFELKIANLLYIITKTDKYVEDVKSTKLEIGKIRFSNVQLENDLAIKYAKSEIISTYYHCLETFMRLFLGHVSLEKCPWLEITYLNIREYRKKLKEIASGKFDALNDKFNEQETILDALVGVKDIKKLKMTDVQYTKLKDWIVWCAQELLNMSEYNSLKHGLVLFPSFGSVKIEAGGMVLSKEGDAVNILSIDETEERYVFNNKTIFVEYDFKVSIIHIFSEMIRNIVYVGKLHYLGSEKKHIEIPGLLATTMDYLEIRDMIFEKDNWVVN